MKILILEDDKERLASFRRELIGHEVFYTDMADTAIKQLEENEWDFLFLDHDLGGEVFVTRIKNTGYEVAIWLEEHPERKPSTIYLHSLNPNGRMRMKQAIPEAIDATFAWRIASKLVEVGGSNLANYLEGSLPIIE